MYLFYTPDIDKAQFLSEEESAHCVRVLRYTKGDEILLTDGKGYTYNAHITDANPKHCAFEVFHQEKQQRSHNFYLHIAIAPTKNIERLEWMVEKCTEIGVDEITLLLCRFSERKQVREERLAKIILSAAKQSLTPYMPRLNPLTDYKTFIHQVEQRNRYIAHCYKEDKREFKDEMLKYSELAHSDSVQDGVVVLIGPEGDFSEQEVAESSECGFLPVGLGKSRLRTETAGVVACHTAILLNS